MQNNLYSFYTTRNNDVNRSVTEGPRKNFTSAELLARTCLQLAYAKYLFRHQVPYFSHVYSVALENRDKSMRTWLNDARRSLAPVVGMRCKEDLIDMAQYAVNGEVNMVQEIITQYYPNALIKTNIKGADRALFDGVSSYILERVAFLYGDIYEFYKGYKHLPSPFLIDVTEMASYSEFLRRHAKATGDNRFYGMMANELKTEKLRFALYPDECDQWKLPVEERFIPSDPIPRVNEQCGVLLGVMWAYFSANHNGDKTSDLVAYPASSAVRIVGSNPLKFDHKFYMSLTKVESDVIVYPKTKPEVFWMVSFGLADAQQMSFFVHEETAMQMQQVLAISKL